MHSIDSVKIFSLPSAPTRGSLMHIVYTLNSVIKQYTISSPSGGCMQPKVYYVKEVLQ